MIRVGDTVPTRTYPDVVPFDVPLRGYFCSYVVAQPRYGKGALAKHFCVKASHHRRFCFFDFKGEWSRHVTHPNRQSEAMDFIAEYKVYRDFTFKLAAFRNPEDWTSMGFHRAVEIRNLFEDTLAAHEGRPDEFLRILIDLPTETKGGLTLEEFNEKYDAELSITQHAETKRAWVRNFEKVRKWFWQGESDPRPIYDFGKEWLEQRNIFVDFSTDTYADTWSVHRNRTFFGKILELLQPHFKAIQGIIVVEEADIILPRWHTAEGVKPSSNQQVIYYVAKAPKYQMGILLIMQNPRQSDEDIRMGGQFVYFLGMFSDYPYPFKDSEAQKLRYDPESNYREFLYVDVNKNHKRFVPMEPCCEFESNIQGGGAV